MAGIFDFLHLKRRGGGSPNELSFDVLDAARTQLDEQKAPKRANTIKSQYQGSIGGGGTLAQVPEVQRRRKIRHGRTFRSKALIVAVACVFLCASVLVGQRIWLERQSFSARLNGLVQQLVAVDGSMVQLDSLMDDLLNPLWENQRQDAINEIPGIFDKLSAISDEAQALIDSPPEQANIDALKDVQAAAAARRAMATQARDSFRLASTISEQIALADGVWKRVIAGDEEAKKASEQANSALTVEATQEARDSSLTAKSTFERAAAELTYLEATIKNLDFSAFKNYLSKRVEALDFAVQTADALLANDRAGAAKANESYNAVEDEAAKLANNLPSGPGSVIADLYKEQLSAAMRAFDKARTQVSSADSDLRSRI